MCCYIAAVKALLIPFCAPLFALYIPFHSHLVIKVQIVLPSLLPIHMAGSEWRIFLKAFIFQVIAPLCLQGAVQVLLFFFHFPDMFWVSGKLPPIILTAICLARLLPDVASVSDWSVWLVDRQSGWVFDGISRCSFVIFGLMKSCAVDLPSDAKRNGVFAS